MIANQKGGVAKTTTVAALGAALAERGRRVLLVDLDAQACLTFALGVDADQVASGVYDVLLGAPAADALVRTEEGLDLLPATIDLAAADAALMVRPGRDLVLRAALEPLAADYDDVLLDCSPSLGVLTLNALTAGDELVIPMAAEMLSHRAVGQLVDTVADVRRLLNPGLVVRGILPTMVDLRTAHAREVLADLGERYGLPVLTPVPRSVRVAEAPARGRSILSTAPRSTAAAAYRELASTLTGS